MLTLTYGFKKPQTNDRGSVVFPALEANWQQVNDHDHNGVNSKKISSASFDKLTQTIAAGSWVLVANGHYRQLVTLPGTNLFDNVTLSFRDDTGAWVYPTVVKNSSNTYYVYVSNNTLTLTAFIN